MNTGRKTGKGPDYGLSGLLKENKPDWEALRRADWFQRLYDCPQEPDYHAEGNVGIHTEMVVESLLGLPEYRDLDPTAQRVLLAAALLHDVAKPACTLTENGRISSPRHAAVGEKVARELLWDLDFETREQICSLVRLHGLPLWALEKPNPWSAVIGASLRTSNYLVYLLAKADVLGRICTDKASLLERVEYFKEFCLDNQCFENACPFVNAHSKFRYFFTGLQYPCELYDDTAFQILLMSGIPGSGKDTFLKNNILPVVSLDDLRRELGVEHGDSKGQGHVVQAAYGQAKKYSAARQSFVWNSTNLTTDLRSKLIQTLSVYNPYFKIVYVETSLSNIFSRRKADIPAAHLERMIRLLDMPLPTEAHEVGYYRND